MTEIELPDSSWP